MRSLKSEMVVGLAALLFAACGGPPNNNPLLDEARVEVNAAGSDPAIVERAPNALEQAETALARGERMLEEEGDPEEIYHQAYLARQYVAIARETADLRAAEDEIKQAESERQRVLVEARERDAEQAREEAEAERERAEDALARAQALEDKVQELEAEATERGLVLTLSDVLFDVGRATLKEGAQRTIVRLADFLEENPERRILIEGHTDNTGSYQLNIGLSQRRAEEVKSALMARGISGSRIRTAGLGPDYPVASNTTSAGRQQNRRVEIIISDKDGRIQDRQ